MVRKVFGKILKGLALLGALAVTQYISQKATREICEDLTKIFVQTVRYGWTKLFGTA